MARRLKEVALILVALPVLLLVGIAYAGACNRGDVDDREREDR